MCKAECERLKVNPCENCELGLTLTDCSDTELRECQLKKLIQLMGFHTDNGQTVVAKKDIIKAVFGEEFNATTIRAMLGYIQDMLRVCDTAALKSSQPDTK